jgi:hypothetical protein
MKGCCGYDFMGLDLVGLVLNLRSRFNRDTQHVRYCSLHRRPASGRRQSLCGGGIIPLLVIDVLDIFGAKLHPALWVNGVRWYTPIHCNDERHFCNGYVPP